MTCPLLDHFYPGKSHSYSVPMSIVPVCCTPAACKQTNSNTNYVLVHAHMHCWNDHLYLDCHAHTYHSWTMMAVINSHSPGDAKSVPSKSLAFYPHFLLSVTHPIIADSDRVCCLRCACACWEKVSKNVCRHKQTHATVYANASSQWECLFVLCHVIVLLLYYR